MYGVKILLCWQYMVEDVVLKIMDIVTTHSQCILLFTANKVTYIYISFVYQCSLKMSIRNSQSIWCSQSPVYVDK